MPLSGINVSFPAITDLINNCAKLKPVHLAVVKICQKGWKCTIWRECEEPLPGYTPADEGIFVQLLLSGTAIIDTHYVNFGFWYVLPLHRAVGVEAGSVESQNFWTFSHPTPTTYRLRSPGRGACAWKVCLRLVVAVYEKWPVKKYKIKWKTWW